MSEILTYVEMTSCDQLNPAVSVPSLALEPLDRDSSLITDLQARIGAPYGWESASRSAEEWEAWFAGCPARRFWLLSFGGKPAGMVNYDLHPSREIEIETFGLLPEFIGKRLGGSALTLAVRQAWELLPSATRVWLHTSSLDHPAALPNYHRRGFRTFKIEEGDRKPLPYGVS
ncbi:GNAT family N-acetyltransferase [Streptomyces sp. NPDC097640]|uniref:GNAT family N-acetyltransferase n=1 Tax=Streptomyces sp. NPDC097640 TaxID=3157229 RepID=UPI003329FAC1